MSGPVDRVKRLCETVEDPNADADTLLERLADVTAVVTALARNDYRRVKTPAPSILVPAYGTPAPSVFVPVLDPLPPPPPPAPAAPPITDIVNQLNTKMDSIAQRLRPRNATATRQVIKRRALEQRFDKSDGYCAVCKKYHEFDVFKINKSSMSFACRLNPQHPGNLYLHQLAKSFASSPFYKVDNLPWSVVTRVIADAYERGFEQNKVLRMVWRPLDNGIPFTVHNCIIE